jgi:hypothetical protein
MRKRKKMPEIKEKPVEGWPGWTKLQLGASRRYVSPGGVEISARRFMELASKYNGMSMIPEADILPPPILRQPPPQGFFNSNPPKTPSNQKPGPKPKSDQILGSEPNQNDYVESIQDVAPHKATRSKSKHPRASAQALGVGIRKLLLLITTLIVAKILNDERACMTDKEASLLGAALGNLLEPTKFNEQFGWMIADTGDYQAIGYVLIMYGSRINDIVQEKRQHEQQRPTAGPSTGQSTPGGNQSGSNGASQPGATMPYSSARPQWIAKSS